MSPSKPTVRRGGWPKRTPEPGERVALSFRVTPERKAALEKAAKNSGRSLTQEVELRLEQSFEADDLLVRSLKASYGPAFAGLLLAIARAMHDTGRSAGFMKSLTLDGSHDWLRDGYAYNQAIASANVIFEHFRPSGDTEAPAGISGSAGSLDLGAVASNLGAGFAAAVLGALAGKVKSGELNQWAAEIRPMLSLLSSDDTDVARTRGEAQ